jgi:U4/U6 small nuclear ribonucleoprotein PRP4
LPDCQPVKICKGHRERTTGISWHPQAYLQQSPEAVNFASGSVDGSVYLWNTINGGEEPLQTLEGHQLRASPFFHPSGRLIGTASFDATWRLWDVETATELLLQEGHSREVMSLAFQHDGALVGSGGMDGFGRIWDLRTGRSIMLLEGHVQSILSMDFSPSGYEIATASDDYSFRLHDLRRLKSSVQLVPAHTSLISAVKFRYQYAQSTQRDSPLDSYYGDFLVSASFDGTAKIWGVGDWKLLRNLAGHQNKIMDMDLSSDGKYIVTASYDRSVKVWTNPIYYEA